MKCTKLFTPEELAKIPTDKLAEILNEQYVFGATCDYCICVQDCMKTRNENKQSIRELFVMRLQKED